MNKPEFVGQRTKSPYKAKYGNYIGGQWVDAVDGETFDNTSPVTGQVICQVARSKAADIEKALDAAHKGGPGLGQDQRGAARRNAQQDRRPDGRASGRHRPRRDLG